MKRQRETAPKELCPVAVPGAPGFLGTADARLRHSRANPAFAQAAGMKCETLVKSAGGGREGVGWTEEIGF